MVADQLAQDDHANPFVRYRRHLDLHRRAVALGLDDDTYIEIATEADEAVRAVEGLGFEVTPLLEIEVPGPEAGSGRPVLAKVETGNVGGSHKARHLFGLLLSDRLETAAAGRPSPSPAAQGRPLAIASCGNAAVGAAVVARAARRRLQVFVPEVADPAVIHQLDRLGAEITACPRRPGVAGDPCVAALDAAIDDGAMPFTVQGPVCPATIDGCRTLGLELADQLTAAGVVGPIRLPIQVGGGALATAVMDGFDRSGHDLAPRLHPVQPAAAHPYVAAWHRLVPRLLTAAGLTDPGDERALAAALAGAVDRFDLDTVIDANAEVMTPWPATPESVASGILDDVTYDWRTVVAHQVRSGGWPVLVDEMVFTRARRLTADVVTPPPDETGAAGLAGLLTLWAEGADEQVTDVVLLTGRARH